MAINSRNSKVFHSGPGSPAAYASIEHVVTISGPDGSAQLIDTTDLESSGKEYLPGLPDSGSLQLECNYTAGTKQMDLFDNFQASADPEPFYLQIPTAVGAATNHTFYFNAVVSKWSLSEAVDQQVKLSIGLKISGAVTYALV
jgi:hypothetical protein